MRVRYAPIFDNANEEKVNEVLVGQTVQKIERYGKFLAFIYDKNVVVSHLRMEGKYHFGIEGKDWHNDKVDRTKEYINTLINEEKPDLIVCSGDNILGTGTNGLNQFIEMMESYQIPWTWVYGNHDAENTATNYKRKK